MSVNIWPSLRQLSLVYLLLHLQRKTTKAGCNCLMRWKRLEPGTYKVEWNGAGPTVQINILQGNKTVATTSGRIVELQRPSSYDDVVLKPVANGNVKTIDEIDFNNRKEGLRLTPNMVSQR
jgi:hypothetical protein